jgi:serpin B
MKLRHEVVAMTGVLLICVATQFATVALAVTRPATQSPAVTSDDGVTVVGGHNAFAVELYRTLSRKPGNLFLSPLSVSLALAMTYAGAGGETAREIAAVMHFPEDKARLAAANAELLTTLDSTDADRPWELSLANRLWGRSDFAFKARFLATTRESYGAELATLDFGNTPELARGTINRWVATETEQKIPALLQSGDLTTETALVLTNAIYFFGRWSQPFPESGTGAQPFDVSASQTVTTAMMSQVGRFEYAALPRAELLQLRYAGDEMALVILLPSERFGLGALEQALTASDLQDWLAALQPRELRIVVPKLKLTSRFELTETLRSLGMVTPFTPRADFSAMTGASIFIDKVIHEARLEVDERGTEAAAATAVVMRKGPQTLRIDHPFLFLIRDLRHGGILFAGRVVDPTTP